jgi:GPH family glycoside/pentoside/hexuronide:cation symporter
VTNVCGLSGSLAGLAMFLALAIDAVADPVIGSISDNLRSRFGRRVPVMAVSLLPIAVSIGLLFSIPRLEGGWLLFGYVLLLLVTLRVSMSGFYIPYLGLGAELSPDYDERSSVVAFRSIFGMAGTLAAFVLGFGVFLGGPKGLLDRDAYGPLGWTAGAVLLLAGALATWASWRNAPRVPVATKTGHALGRRLLEELRDTFRNRSFRLLFGGVLVFFVGYGIAQTLGLNGNKYYWGLEVAQIQTIALAMVGGMALGLPLAFGLIGRVEKRSVVVSAS